MIIIFETLISLYKYMLVIHFIVGIVVFLGGLYFYLKHANIGIMESMDANTSCPNLLIQVGAKYYLLNSKTPRVPGVNPLEFRTLEDYNEFLTWQKTVNINCPVLYVQNTYDAQGNRVFKIRPDAMDTQGGLPPSPPTYIASSTPTTNTINNITVPNIEYPPDLTPKPIPKSTSLSDDPMNVNWGGSDYTENSVNSGKYAGSEVMLPSA